MNQLSTFSAFRNFTHMTSIRNQHPPSAARDLGRTVQRIIVEQNRLWFSMNLFLDLRRKSRTADLNVAPWTLDSV